jgi:23S rRNA (cytosine1962-C5)-methyltransferase
MLSREAPTSEVALLRTRLEAAAEFRKRVVRDTNSYRLVHAEADQLPGLIIDRYDDVLVLQTLDQGMDRVKPQLVELLHELFAPAAIVERNDAPVRKLEGLPLLKGVLKGELSGPISVKMNGLDLTADVLGGQKTGVFLDQRENYLAARSHARGRVLDCFCSTGGFAVHAAAGAESVEAVDASPVALEAARANATRNNIENVNFREADVFALLSDYGSGRRHFDTIVLDPPAFAKSRATVDKALGGYKEINLRALKMLEPGGILMTYSCSHHVSEADLLGVIAEASIDAGRKVRVLERRSQAADHPILLTVPETLYLKGAILEVIP